MKRHIIYKLGRFVAVLLMTPYVRRHFARSNRLVSEKTAKREPNKIAA